MQLMSNRFVVQTRGVTSLEPLVKCNRPTCCIFYDALAKGGGGGPGECYIISRGEVL